MIQSVCNSIIVHGEQPFVSPDADAASVSTISPSIPDNWIDLKAQMNSLIERVKTAGWEVLSEIVKCSKKKNVIFDGTKWITNDAPEKVLDNKSKVDKVTGMWDLKPEHIFLGTSSIQKTNL